MTTNSVPRRPQSIEARQLESLRNPPSLEEIRTFPMDGERSDRFGPVLPKYLIRAMELVAKAAGQFTPTGQVCQWAIRRGVARLNRTADVREIVAARGVLLGHGNAALDDWNYVVAARDGGSKRFTLRSLAPKDLAEANDLASGLGLNTSVLISLAVMAALIDAGGPYTDAMADELRAFTRSLKQRADLARALLTVAEADPPPTFNRVPWTGLLEQ